MNRFYILFFIVIGFHSKLLAQEEFNGPLSSWANVKTRFGAKGDGLTDDTRAIQFALDSLSDRQVNFNTGNRSYTVVYLPAGNYIISSTLVLRGKIGVRIVGEDPSKTILVWKGNDQDTMVWANGSAYFYFGRMTLDPGGRKKMEGVGVHWKSRWREANNASSATVNIELADLIFRDGFAKGIAGGTAEEGINQNDSEILINRCVFNKCSEAGIAIRGYNALDYWIWYCRFNSCTVGVSNNSGNYHIYYCYFKKSSNSDVLNINSYYTSVRFCYSTGSRVFSLDNGKSSNPFKRIFQSNIILNPLQTPIQYYHTGKVTLIDNYCRVPAKSPISSFLVYDTWAGTYYTVMELGNTFENFANIYSMPVRDFKVYKSKRKLLGKTDTLEKSFFSRFSTTPTFVKRTVFTVPSGASAQEIQSIVNKASATGNRAIVHFPFGIYTLEKEIVIEKNSDIQVVGDGLLYASMLIRKNGDNYKNGSVFKVFGPASVVFKDLNLQTKDGKPDNSRAIAFFNIDQPGSTFLIDQLYAGMDSTLLVVDYDNLYIQKTNSFFSGGTYLYGGAATKAGAGKFRMSNFSGQFANTQVYGNASFLATDCWWEGDKTKIPLNFSGTGNILIQGAMIAPGNPDSNTTIIKLGKFDGKIALMDMYVQGKIEVLADNPRLDFVLWNINFYHKKRPLLFVDKQTPSYHAFMAGITSQCFDAKDPDCQSLINTKDRMVNIVDEENFVENVIDQIRAVKPILYGAKPKTASNIYMNRVSISSMYQSAIAVSKQ